MSGNQLNFDAFLIPGPDYISDAENLFSTVADDVLGGMGKSLHFKFCVLQNFKVGDLLGVNA